MAGLLDIFGTSGADTMGLLGMSPADIARNRDDAQAQALYALAGRLFQGGNTGQSIAEGLQRGQQAYRGGMQEALQGQLQNVQLQDMIRKRQLEQQQLAEQQRIQGVIQGAVTKPQEIYGEDMMGNRVGEGMTAPSFDLQRAVPQLIGTAEGRKTLSELVAAQKAMRPEGYTLGEGQVRYEIGADGKPMAVAQGAPKENLTSTYRDFQQAVKEGYEGNFMQYQKDLKNAGAPKFAVDLNDKTAVAKTQLATINQWQSTLKETGDTTVAARASAFYDAYDKAKKGNPSADSALIYNLAKIYDPSGAVQQGDIKTIVGNPSIPQRVQLLAQQLASGGTFTPQQRLDTKAIVDGTVAEREKALAPTINVYRGLNAELGGNPNAIINPYDTVRKPEVSSGLPSGVTVKKKG